MRTKFFLSIIVILLLNSCNKSDAPINFNCQINGSYIQGTGVTYYTNPPTFELKMTSSNNIVVNIFWYNIDSTAGIRTQLTAKTYTMPANPLPPFVASASYTTYSGTTYYTGQGTVSTGTVTITNNTGVGGTMSGTFNFNALNPNSPYDTVYVTQGTFTNVRVGTS